MKLLVKCSFGGESAGTKELMIHNPVATLSNLRAAIAINFRLPVHGFRMLHGTADLSCEKVLLRESGVRDGDVITVAAKREREEESHDSGEEDGRETSHTTQTPLRPQTFVPAAAPAATTTTPEGAGPTADPVANGESGEDDSDNDDDTDDDEDDGMENASTELLCHLLATVPNLVEMRRQFLANPVEIMQQIQERDPRLFELITANHQEFVDLVNNESLVETLQQERDEADEAFFDEEEEFEEEGELDQGLEATINSVMAQFLAGGGDVSGEVDDEPRETQRYLERVPTEEEEAKIEQLMQLGFTRDQCKVAFFKSRRSLERAANLLFEDPPQL